MKSVAGTTALLLSCWFVGCGFGVPEVQLRKSSVSSSSFTKSSSSAPPSSWSCEALVPLEMKWVCSCCWKWWCESRSLKSAAGAQFVAFVGLLFAVALVIVRISCVAVVEHGSSLNTASQTGATQDHGCHGISTERVREHRRPLRMKAV